MAISSPITFLGNGRPTSPARGLRVNREPSRQGIAQTTPNRISEVIQVAAARRQAQPQSLGRKAVEISKSTGIAVNVVI